MTTLRSTLFGSFAAAAAMVTALSWSADAQTANPVQAANPGHETIATHPTWVYSPAATLGNGKRGLLVALHGCGQTADQLWTWGNLKAAADAKGMVVAVPDVGANPWGGAKVGCWDYDGGNDASHHAAQIIDLTRTLMGRAPLDIDPNHVYVAGLSSGAALSLVLGCTAPDLYAGIGAVAGPSVGSMQMMATATVIAPTNVATARYKCEALAGGKAPHFATQIANMGYGAMDKGGPDARYPYYGTGTAHTGQYALVATQWSIDNTEVLHSIYGTGPLGAATTPLPGAKEWSASANGKNRLTKLEIAQVGHAWAAGTGRPNNPDSGGLWMAQSGLDYPAYITDWFLKNNVRATAVTPVQPPAACAQFTSNNYEHVQAGRAYDRMGMAYAVGSNMVLGWDNPFLVTVLAQSQPGFYSLGYCFN